MNLHHAAMLVLLASPSLCSAQTTTPPTSGVTSGIVEAVIGNGDLVPARFAKIYALPGESAAGVRAILQQFSDALKAARANAHNQPARDLVEIQCVKGLIQIQPKFVLLGQAPGSIAAGADELGEFTLKSLLNQTYTVFAIGRAGMNAALWIEDLTAAKQPERLKLTKPSISCYDPDAYFKR